MLDSAPDCHCEEPPGRHNVPPEVNSARSNFAEREHGIEIASLALRASSQ